MSIPSVISISQLRTLKPAFIEHLHCLNTGGCHLVIKSDWQFAMISIFSVSPVASNILWRLYNTCSSFPPKTHNYHSFLNTRLNKCSWAIDDSCPSWFDLQWYHHVVSASSTVGIIRCRQHRDSCQTWESEEMVPWFDGPHGVTAGRWLPTLTGLHRLIHITPGIILFL